jgi:hypothetical protein
VKEDIAKDMIKEEKVEEVQAEESVGEVVPKSDPVVVK